MDPELFLLELSESEECKNSIYIRLSIKKSMGVYYAMKLNTSSVDILMTPFREYIRKKMEEKNVNADELLKYMIENDRSICSVCLAGTLFKSKMGLTSEELMDEISSHMIITPFVDVVDMDVLAIIVDAFVFDNLCKKEKNIREIVGKEEFGYPINSYGLTKVNGAIFKKDGLIYDGKGYFYNIFTDKRMLNPWDKTIGFAKIINDEAGNCDILYRIDERFAIPAAEYNDHTGMEFAKVRGPQFNFQQTNLNRRKTIVVHMNEETLDKLLLVIKQRVDQENNEEFWNVEIETLPHIKTNVNYVITTFLHGIYYPRTDKFVHIDYTKNQYDMEVYLDKYADSQNGIPVDQYTEIKDLHYKIWCIENGEFKKETWYKLMMISLPNQYQELLNEMLSLN